MTINPAAWDVLTFDCYGTLVDWEQGLAEVLERMLGRYRVSVPRAELLERFAEFESEAEHGGYVPYREVLGAVAQRMGAEYGAALSDRDAEQLAKSVPEWPAFPDTVAALARLATRYRLGVLSNIDDDLFAGTAAHLGVPFDPVVTAQQVSSYKPALQNFHALLDQVGVPPVRVLHVAQSVFHDIAPATELGLSCVWVDRRQGRPGGATPPSDVAPKWGVTGLAELAELLCPDRSAELP
jgi:2-haloacid dehalogenase